MSLSKQDFIALADIIKSQRPTTDSYQPGRFTLPEEMEFATYQWEDFIQRLAQFCASRNPRFNREHWLGYIAGTNGPNGGKVKVTA